MIKIESIDQLKEESISGADFGLMLSSRIRSSKHIAYHPDTDRFEIYNLVDNTHQIVTTDTLPDKTIILEAIATGRFFKDTED